MYFAKCSYIKLFPKETKSWSSPISVPSCSFTFTLLHCKKNLCVCGSALVTGGVEGIQVLFPGHWDGTEEGQMMLLEVFIKEVEFWPTFERDV